MRVSMPGLAVAVGGCAWIWHWSLPAASSLLSGVALLAGASLSSFAYLLSLRLQLTARPDDAWLQVERDSVDEGATHLLLSILLAVVDAALIVVGPTWPLWLAPQAASVTGGGHRWS